MSTLESSELPRATRVNESTFSIGTETRSAARCLAIRGRRGEGAPALGGARSSVGTMSSTKGYADAMNATSVLLGSLCLGTLSCGGSSREPLANATVGKQARWRRVRAAMSQSSERGREPLPTLALLRSGVRRGTGGGTASGGANAGGGTTTGGASANGGTAGAAPVATRAEQLAAVGPYCDALATICPNFETATCTSNGRDRLPLQGDLCYAEQVRRNMCTLLLRADDLQCSSASSGMAKPGLCDAEQATVLACLGQ